MFSGDLFCQSQPVGAVCDRTWAGHPGGGGLKLAVTVGPQSASSWRTAPETPPGSESALTRPLCRKRVWWVPHRKADKNKEKDLSDGESLRPFCGSFWLKYCVGMRGITTTSDYLIMEATSAAKSSSAFSMPSPVANRVNALTVMEPPSSLATAATCFSTEILFSLTKACWSKQFSS